MHVDHLLTIKHPDPQVSLKLSERTIIFNSKILYSKQKLNVVITHIIQVSLKSLSGDAVGKTVMKC